MVSLRHKVFFPATLIILLFLFYSCGVAGFASSAKVIYPVEFGICEARSGIESYSILYNCHKAAVKNNYAISYQGVTDVYIEIPKDAEPIPLAKNTDFAGVKLHVLNNSKDCYLFQLKNFKTSSIPISVKEINDGDFSRRSELKPLSLIIIEDEKPWVEKRRGYNYGAQRKDLLVVNNNRSTNNVIYDYSNETSKPKAFFCEYDKEKKSIANVSLYRDAKSSYITNLVRVENQYNVEIKDVTIVTPADESKYGDFAITINNTANLVLTSININGTYSQTKRFGYGISLNNVYNVKIQKLTAKSKWGVFGNYNVNKAILTESKINRFDIHCYGRDILFENCVFNDMYNQFSSVYGLVCFKACSFTNYTPVVLESSFNAYTPFSLYFLGCTFNIDGKHNCIVSLMGGLPLSDNPRAELTGKNLPNVIINKCRINNTDGVNNFYVFDTGLSLNTQEVGINEVIVKKTKYNGEKPEMKIFTRNLRTSKSLKLEVK